MIIFHELRLYWNWAGSNIGAMPACGLIALIAGAIGTYCFRRPLARMWKRIKTDLQRGVRDDLSEIRAVAEAAHRIAADTHKALTGLDHPDAPVTANPPTID